MKKEKEIALKTVLFNYAEISKKNDIKLAKEITRILDRLLKKYKKLTRTTILTPQQSNKATIYFEKYKEIDMDSFDEETDFSAFIMVVLLLDYILIECEDLQFKVEFGDLKPIVQQMINELETNGLRKQTMYHHRVVTKMIEV